MPEKFTSYGLREINIAPLVADETETTYGALTRAWGAQTASATVAVSEQTLRGDDGILEIDSNISNVEFSFENAVLSFEYLQTILGGQLDDILATEGGAVIGKKYTIQGASSLPYFAMIAKTEKQGSLKMVLYKCKASGGVEFSFEDENYCVISVSGQCARRESDGNLMSLLKYDETSPITLADLD